MWVAAVATASVTFSAVLLAHARQTNRECRELQRRADAQEACVRWYNSTITQLLTPLPPECCIKRAADATGVQNPHDVGS